MIFALIACAGATLAANNYLLQTDSRGELRRYHVEGKRRTLDWEAGAMLKATIERNIIGPAPGEFADLPLGDTSHSQPILVGNKVAVNADDGMLHVFQEGDGTQFFSYFPNAFSKQEHPSLQASPAASGTVVVSGMAPGAKGLFAIDAVKALPLWEFTERDDAKIGLINAAPQIVHLGNKNEPYALVASGAVYLIAINNPPSVRFRKGQNYVRIDLPSTQLSPPGVVINADGSLRHIYVGDAQGRIWRIDVKGQQTSLVGQPLFDAPQAIRAAPKIVFTDTGYLVIAATSRAVYAIPDSASNKGSQKPAWQHELQESTEQASPLIAADRVIVSTSNGNDPCSASTRVYVYDTLSGIPRARASAQTARYSMSYFAALDVVNTPSGAFSSKQERHIGIETIGVDGQVHIIDSFLIKQAAKRLSWREISSWQGAK